MGEEEYNEKVKGGLHDNVRRVYKQRDTLCTRIVIVQFAKTPFLPLIILLDSV